MRNRFKVGEVLEKLSKENNNEQVEILRIEDESGEEIDDCKVVQQRVYLKTNVKLKKYDILRRKKADA